MTILSGIKPSIANRIRRDLHWCLLARNQCLNHCVYVVAFIKHFCHFMLSVANFVFAVLSWLYSFLIMVYSLSIFIASFMLLVSSWSSFLLRCHFWTNLGIESSQNLVLVGWVGSESIETYFYNLASLPFSNSVLTIFKHTWIFPQVLTPSLSSQSSMCLCHWIIFLPSQKASMIPASW